MGGSSGGGSYIGDQKALERKAKEALLRSQSRKKNIFISFAHEDENEINLLRGQAKNEKNDIEFNDFSVKEPFDSKRAEYIQQKIAERINQSSITIVYLSENTKSSKWVEWEVNKSIELGKKVIVVYPGEKQIKMPSWMNKNLKVLPWSKLNDEL